MDEHGVGVAQLPVQLDDAREYRLFGQQAGSGLVKDRRALGEKNPPLRRRTGPDVHNQSLGRIEGELVVVGAVGERDAGTYRPDVVHARVVVRLFGIGCIRYTNGNTGAFEPQHESARIEPAVRCGRRDDDTAT